MNFQQLAPLIGSVISIGGIIFKMGQHAEKIDVLNITVHAQEKKVDINHSIINKIHNDINILKNDISYMKEDVHDINNKLDKTVRN